MAPVSPQLADIPHGSTATRLSPTVTKACRHPWPALALALGGAVAFSGKAIIIKLAYRHGVDAVTLIMLRMVCALPLFALMVWWAGRKRAPMARRDLLAAGALGFCGYYLSSYLDFLGLQYVSASLERLILYLAPSMVMLLGWVIYRRRVGAHQLVAAALGYGGLLIVFGHELHVDGPQVALGAAFVVASTLCYAVYLIYSGEVVRRIGALRLAGWASIVASVLCIAQYLWLRPAASVLAVDPAVLWLSLLNGTVCTAAPVLMVMMAIERIGPALTAQLGMIGPISTITLGVLLLGEPFTAWVAAGSFCVFGAVWLLTRQPSASR